MRNREPTMRFALLTIAFCAGVVRAELPERWFYVARNLNSDQEVADFQRLCAIAAQHGYTGVCWASPEGVARWKADRLARLEQVKRICAEYRLEIIPLLFSVGYGGAALGYDRNLAVGLPVEAAPFAVKGGQADLVADTGLGFKNPGFEEARGDQMAGWQFHDKPGQVTFWDRQVKHSGQASLRFENPGAKGFGQHARVAQEFTVQPRRHYRLRAWVKCEDARPVGSMRFQVYTTEAKARNLVAASVNAATADWHEETFEFNSGSAARLRLYFGTWGGQTGRFWLDDVTLEELGLTNVLRRDGCPLTVRSADGATTYEEGRDFEPVADPRLLDMKPRPAPVLKLSAGSRLKEGQQLKVSWYHAGYVADRQISVCMSAPKLYEHYEQVAKRLAEVLPTRKFLLSMDEIRQGGTDLADRERKLSMAQILGDCITKQQAILRRHHPDATCYIWSDMLDPGHNAHGDYYQVDGDFTGAVDCVPKDLAIACWYGSQARRSLDFFSQRGFRTLGAAYYDSDQLDGSRVWLRELLATPQAVGIMYTTWQNKYDLLAPFGDMVRAGG